MAHRRYSLSIRDAADLVSVPVTVQTYRRLSEYASLMDIHDSERRAASGNHVERTKASEQAMTDHPELWAFYHQAKQGFD